MQQSVFEYLNKPNNFSPDPENIITDSKQYNTMSVIMRTLISPQSISTQQFIQAITTEQLELSTLIKFNSAIVDAPHLVIAILHLLIEFKMSLSKVKILL